MIHKCHHCGQHLDPQAYGMELYGLSLGRVEKPLLGVLIKAKGTVVPTERIIARVYRDDRDRKGPKAALQVAIHMLNTRMLGTDYWISYSRTNDGYALLRRGDPKTETPSWTTRNIHGRRRTQAVPRVEGLLD